MAFDFENTHHLCSNLVTNSTRFYDTSENFGLHNLDDFRVYYEELTLICLRNSAKLLSFQLGYEFRSRIQVKLKPLNALYSACYIYTRTRMRFPQEWEISWWWRCTYERHRLWPQIFDIVIIIRWKNGGSDGWEMWIPKTSQNEEFSDKQKKLAKRENNMLACDLRSKTSRNNDGTK